MIASPNRIDPLHTLIAGAFVAGTPRPVPLVATRFDIVIEAGLAVVSTTWTYRNTEEESIEATITFPVPVHATLFALAAKIGERVLNARATRKRKARSDYEDAIDRGKTAVLHEEVLRGVHMLSVGHIPPETEIEVRTSWAITLTNMNGRGQLRIPLTVGDIYGRSPLPDCDDLIYGGAAQTAALTVQCGDGIAILRNGRLDEGRATVGLNAPIDLEVTEWKPKELNGRAADGREVILRIGPCEEGDADLNLAILIDRSGSMSEACSASPHAISKFQAMIGGLGEVIGQLHSADKIELWEFADNAERVGADDDLYYCERSDHDLLPSIILPELLALVGVPQGGTEIGSALARVVGESEASDLLVITDGKSHALDVHALAQSGHRISVVLIGEDSLEANIGHLASLTGGEIFIAAGLDLRVILEQALRSLRVPVLAQARTEGAMQDVSVRRAGMTVSAHWQDAEDGVLKAENDRAVVAFASSLALPTLSAREAAKLAEAEGLVTHLTSFVLVDEEGVAQGTMPASRKIALATPRTSPTLTMRPGAAPSYRAMAREVPPPRMRFKKRGFLSDLPPRLEKLRSDPRTYLLFVAESIDWDHLARTVDWSHLVVDLLNAFDAWARSGSREPLLAGLDRPINAILYPPLPPPELDALAWELGVVPRVLAVLVLMAHVAGRHSRAARRIANAFLRHRPPEVINAALEKLGLSDEFDDCPREA